MCSTFTSDPTTRSVPWSASTSRASNSSARRSSRSPPVRPCHPSPPRTGRDLPPLILTRLPFRTQQTQILTPAGRGSLGIGSRSRELHRPRFRTHPRSQGPRAGLRTRRRPIAPGRLGRGLDWGISRSRMSGRPSGRWRRIGRRSGRDGRRRPRRFAIPSGAPVPPSSPAGQGRRCWPPRRSPAHSPAAAQPGGGPSPPWSGPGSPASVPG